MKWDLTEFTLDLSTLGDYATDTAQLEKAHDSLAEKLRTHIGFFDSPTKIASHLDAIQAAATDLRQKNTAAVCLGIGGSHLGAMTLLDGLRPAADADAFPILWGSNFDPPFVERLHNFMAKHESLAAVAISKSGNTVETLSGFAQVVEQKTQPLVVTDDRTGELRRLAQTRQWPSLSVPADVGGRYSVLTAVGLLPAAMGGIDIYEVLAGAVAMRERLLECSAEENPAYLLAAAKHSLHTKSGFEVQYLMPYWSSLRTLSDWYVQLWAESLGKQNSGPTPAAALGSQDQHSLLQMFKEGPKNKLIGFLNVLDEGEELVRQPNFDSPTFSYLWNIPVGRLNRLACDSTQTSLSRSGVPSYRIDVPRLSPRSLGALLFFFEVACAFSAELYGVNAFDQPGVEEAKRLLRDALQK